jgi:radical SAM superfamily enzyme YgiQ (UPF0313 family)
MAIDRTQLGDIERRLAGERGSRFVQGGPRVGMLYPSPYRAGMSSLGFQSVLGVLQDAGISAERAFLPDDVPLWRASRAPLCTYETKTPLGQFPVIGISLAYELELAGLITALELAGIPPLRADRGPQDPRIILGGPLTFSNPLPAAPFVDAMLLGEAEHLVVPAFEAALSTDNPQWLQDIVALPGAYVPELHGSMLPPVAAAPDALLPARGHILAPEAELSDMFLIEGERGCHRMCTFCVMRRTTNGGMRLVPVDRLLSLIPDAARRVGFVGAAISDHPDLVPLLQGVVEAGREVGVSSLRADRIARKPDIAKWLRAGGYKTLTVASDAATEALRKEIAKGTKEQHLLACAEQARALRFKRLKVYMMVGVPGEVDSDIDELIRFTRQLAEICNVSLGIAPFVPKRNTPLDIAGFAGIKVVERRLKHLSRGLKGKAEVRPTSARWAWVEAELAQGGPESGEAVLQAVHAGGKFSDWKQALLAVDPATQAPWRAVG